MLIFKLTSRCLKSLISSRQGSCYFEEYHVLAAPFMLQMTINKMYIAQIRIVAYFTRYMAIHVLIPEF